MAVSQGRQYTRQTTYGRDAYAQGGSSRRDGYAQGNASRRDTYIQGNVVRQPDIRRRPQEETPGLHDINRKHAKKRKMNLSYVLFLTVAMIICGANLISYITLNSEVTSSVKHIAALESNLNDLKLENDEEYSRIKNSVNLEDIKKQAIGTLGMTYAKEGQIITFTEQDDDYIRQVADIPEL